MSLLETTLSHPSHPMAASLGMDRGLPFPVPPRLNPQAQNIPNALAALARQMPTGASPGLGPVSMGPETYVYLLQDTIMRLREAEATIAEQKERIDHLETLSMTDELTSLLNRRGFVEAFRRELAGAKRNGGGGVLVIIDLDGFKAINDTHGHLCGDWYLRQAARVLRDNVRGHDIVARFGGDEFAVLLTRTEAIQGAARAEALAQVFNQQTCHWQMKALPLRASFGTEAYGPEDKEEEIVRRADAGMYRAKRSTRTAR